MLTVEQLKFTKSGSINRDSVNILIKNGLMWCAAKKHIVTLAEYRSSRHRCKQCATNRAICIDPKHPNLTFRSDGSISRLSSKMLATMEQRWCSQCRTILSIDVFARDLYTCKACKAILDKQWILTPEGRFSHAKALGKQRQEWDLILEQYTQIVRQPCEYCKFTNNSSGVGLDRIDNSVGYTANNVLSCCTECNVARSDHFTPEEMKSYVGPAIRAAKLARAAK